MTCISVLSISTMIRDSSFPPPPVHLPAQNSLKRIKSYMRTNFELNHNGTIVMTTFIPAIFRVIMFPDHSLSVFRIWGPFYSDPQLCRVKLINVACSRELF